MNLTNGKQLVIVGGVAAGASCAARARRLDESAQITLIERGPDVSFANCGLPYFIGGEIKQRDVLAVQTPQTLKAILAIDVRTSTEAIAIDRGGKRVQLREIAVGTTEWLPYDNIYAAGDAIEIKDFVSGDATSVPLGGPANRQGRLAADHIFHPERTKPYPGALGHRYSVWHWQCPSSGWLRERRLPTVCQRCSCAAASRGVWYCWASP